MNQNQARPFFRVLYGLLACLFWSSLYFIGSSFISLGNGDWFFLIVLFAFCVFLFWVGFLSTFVALKGRLPIKPRV
jgi:hypothetical protein